MTMAKQTPDNKIPSIIPDESLQDANPPAPSGMDAQAQLLEALGYLKGFGERIDAITMRIDRMEQANDLTRAQVRTVDHGRAIEIPDSSTVHPAAVRELLLGPIEPSEPGMVTRWASKGSIIRRKAQGWRVHPTAQEVGDAIPIEIQQDHPQLLARRSRLAQLNEGTAQKMTDESRQGPHKSPDYPAIVETRYERRSGGM